MLDPSQQELISAHVDGQLAADELRAAERLLDENPQARKLSEELRQLRRRMAELPRHRLDDGFAAAVLRASERALLLGTGEPAAQDQDKRTPKPVSPVQPLVPRRDAGLRAWRPAVGFVAGAAAAVLAMLAWPTGPAFLPRGNDQVTQNVWDEEETAERLSPSNNADDPLDVTADDDSTVLPPGAAIEGNVDNGSQAARDKQANGIAAPTADAVENNSFDETPVDRTEQQLPLGVNALRENAEAEQVPSDASADIVLIQVRLTAAAARQQVVAEVLRANGVTVEAAPPQPPTAARNRNLFDSSLEETRREAVASEVAEDGTPADELLIVATSPEQLSDALAALATRDGVVAESRVGIPSAYLLPRLFAGRADGVVAEGSLATDSEVETKTSISADGPTSTNVTAGAAAEQTAPQQGSGFVRSLRAGDGGEKSRAYRMRITPAAAADVANGRGVMSQPAGGRTSAETGDRQSLASLATDSKDETDNAARQVQSIWVLRVTAETAASAPASND